MTQPLDNEQTKYQAEIAHAMVFVASNDYNLLAHILLVK